MVETFDSWIHQVGLMAYVFLCLAALLEYVFPPFPGDTIVLLGGIYAVRGEKPWLWVFAAITLGSVAGSAFDYYVGRKIARRMERNPEKRRLGASTERLHSLQERVRHRGTWLLLGNRFLPGVRALIFAAAGAAELPFGRTMALGAVSAAAWNLILLGLGVAVGGNAERLEGLVRQYYLVVYGLLGVAVLAATVRFLYRRRVAWKQNGEAVR